jgi:hypothetical protein
MKNNDAVHADEWLAILLCTAATDRKFSQQFCLNKNIFEFMLSFIDLTDIHTAYTV